MTTDKVYEYKPAKRKIVPNVPCEQFQMGFENMNGQIPCEKADTCLNHDENCYGTEKLVKDEQKPIAVLVISHVNTEITQKILLNDKIAWMKLVDFNGKETMFFPRGE